MSETVIKVENLSKQYRLGKIGTGTFSHDVNRWWHKVRGKEDPYLKIGETNDRSVKGGSDYVWSLRDINFEIRQGDAVGVIGRNGAGKSTLLKILSRITEPTTGNIKIRGRVASLLEVGTGFHPELSGKENVYLNGAILGMTRNEIKRKFDEIVDFAGVDRYIDTPVKRYSSGMYVRLAFAVAAHLEPEILVVDEVLAVGDAQFQQKALGKMQDVSKGEGRTILFVSHNMAAIQKLCNTGLLLRNGTLSGTGDVKSMVSQYLLENQSQINTEFVIDPLDCDSKMIWIEAAHTEVNGVKTNSFTSGDDVSIKIRYRAKEADLKCKLFIGIYDSNEVKLLHLGTAFSKNEVFQSKLEGNITCHIPKCPLVAGRYTVNLSLHVDGLPYHRVKSAFNIEVSSGDFYHTGKLPDVKESKFLIEQSWLVQ